MTLRAEEYNAGRPQASPEPTTATGAPDDLYFFAMPVETFKALSAAATGRGMTFAEALKTAIGDFMKAGGRDGT